MYRIYDRPEAIKRVQDYLRIAANPNIFVAPSGVYDENTRLSVRDFQSSRGLEPTGEVDRVTFDLLFSEYAFLTNRNALRDALDSFIFFPILPGSSSNGMMHINRTLARVLDYYGFTHRLRSSNFYSGETSEAVRILRGVYLMGGADLIDEEFYQRLIKDHDSMGQFNNNFS